MEKKQRLFASLLFAMRVSFVQLMIALLLVTSLYAKETRAQSVTEKEFSVSVENVTLESLILKVEKASKVKFSFSPNRINGSKLVNYTAKKKRLIDFINEVLIPNGIGFREVKERIVLFPLANTQIEGANGALNTFTYTAADIIVKGTVKDEKGNPLEGVTVTVKGTKISTTTDKQGKYTISVSDTKATLVFSSVGFSSTERGIPASKTVDVVLKELVTALDDVVVVGYGTQRRKDVTGSVSKAPIEDIQKAPVKSFEDALAGRIAGVNVTSQEGAPGAGNNITIRGIGSLTQDASPLYVIDGFPIENPNNNAVNPNDIESIEILKDASATAIYGSRGSNGVIIITTKKGKEGPPKINYEVFTGTAEATRKLEVMSPYEYVKLQLELDPIIGRNTYLNTDANGGAVNSNRKQFTLEDYKNVTPIDWQYLIFRTAVTTSHTLTLSGGSKSTKYLLSGNIFNQDGIVIATGFKRYQARLALDQEIGKNIKAGININFSNSKTYGAVTSTSTRGDFNSSLHLLYAALSRRPFEFDDEDIINDQYDPLINQSNDYRTNPVTEAMNILRETVSNNSIANFYLDYNPAKYFKLRSTFGITYNQNVSNNFNNSRTLSGNVNNPQGSANGVNGSVLYSNNLSWVNENTLNYNRTFNGVHKLGALVGFTQQGNRNNSYGAAANFIPNESLGLSGMDEGTPVRITSTSGQWFLVSFLGRLNYDFKGRYLATFNYRADGSSKFAESNRWGNFIGGALAWRLSAEPFMRGLSFIDDAKLRISYGAIGNNRVSDYATFASMQFTNNNVTAYPFNNTITNNGGAIQQGVANKDLRWESNITTNLALEFSMFKHRFSGVVELYDRVSDDLLLNAQIPYVTGFANVFRNIGKISNKGIEITLNTVNLTKRKLTWTTSFNISFNRDKVLALTNNQETLTSSQNFENSTNPLYIAKINQPVAQFYGLIHDGIYQYEDFNYNPTTGTYVLKDNITTNNRTRTAVQPGDSKFKDLNGDLVIDANDYTVIGRTTPIHSGGFTNNFSYKGFSLNIFFQWSYGNDIYNANRMALERGGNLHTNQLATYADRWTATNPSNEYSKIYRQTNLYNSRVVEDGSFLRLRTINFGYDIPGKTLKSLKYIKSVRLYLAAQNIYTWTKYTGYDPEVAVKYSALTPGFDYSAYPRARTFTVGANFSF